MPDKKLTDNEIIKALECCMKICEDCDNCPYINNNDYTNVYDCKDALLKNALDLINRQKAENKELKTENLILSQKRFNIFERIEFADKLKKQAKAEAYKEFAEIYTEQFITILNLNYEQSEIARKIKQNLIKKLVGEEIATKI